MQNKKGMYELKQAALLAYDFLAKNLKPYGYYLIPHTEGIWKHISRPITFYHCVDDIGVKYFNKSDVGHLIHALEQDHKSTVD